jgi:ATP:ADP antiporter, AAA family
MCVLFGSIHNCLTRASKFTLFDATKEIAFIPLSKESRVKGKAAIDGVGSRIGKSGGSVIHQGLLMIFSTLTATAPIVAFIFLGITVVWVFAVKALGKQFGSLTHDQKADELETAKEKLTLLQEKNLQTSSVEKN